MPAHMKPKCDECGRKCAGRAGLAAHMRKHQPDGVVVHGLVRPARLVNNPQTSVSGDAVIRLLDRAVRAPEGPRHRRRRGRVGRYGQA